MDQKSWIGVAVLGAIIIIVAVIASSGSSDDVKPRDTVNQPQTGADVMVEDQPVVTKPEIPVVTTPTTAATSTTATKPVVTQPAVKSFTLTQVNSHTSADDCWTVVGNSVYDLTPFVMKHPGGVRSISKVCGRDGTAFFEEQHGGQRQAEAALASLKIGVLVQ